MSSAIAFERVSKHYRGGRGYRALRDDLVGAVGRLVGRNRSGRDRVRALDDVSFEIPEGQSFALIGENGAGKTTALKLASRIAYPTDGEVLVRGRVGALIEVGSGMHPELTGRENISLYGRILGLSKQDIFRRFDDIVEFADIGSAIDQPVKQYSSGMQLRLGFSLAAHLEPDVLLVDEAIAVGDAGFQYRCIERMAGLVREGRTLVFVSHDMSAVETLCKRAILLREGRVELDSAAGAVVHAYFAHVYEDIARTDQSGISTGAGLEIMSVALYDSTGCEVEEIPANTHFTIRIHYHASEVIAQPHFSIGLSDGRAGCFTMASMLIDGFPPQSIEGEGFLDCVFEGLPLQPKTYEIWGSVRGRAGFGDIVDWQRFRRFRVTPTLGNNGVSSTSAAEWAPLVLPYRWEGPHSKRKEPF